MLNEYEPSKYNYVLSIDVGVKNLAISIGCCGKDWECISIPYIEHTDITTFLHNTKEDEEKCSLYHDKTYTDYLEHVFHARKKLFDLADVILIERQPPEGYVVVEQLIFSKYRSKAILISPNSVHKYLCFRHYDYEQRKVKSVEFALKHIQHEGLLHYFHSLERNHDIADSICILFYWLYKKRLDISIQEREQYIKELQNKPRYVQSLKDLDIFKFKGN